MGVTGGLGKPKTVIPSSLGKPNFFIVFIATEQP